VILAAGASTRYGRPKQLLSYQGKSLLRRAAEAAVGSTSRPIVVVLGASAARCAEELQGLPVHAAENATWMEGMGTSLRIGVEAVSTLAPDAMAVIVTLCDQPFVSARIINALDRRYRESGVSIVASAYAGTLGVPALFDRSLFDELRACHGGEGARHVIERHKGDAEAVPFPAGIVDIDTPQDYAAIQALDALSNPGQTRCASS
jgi:molybdenum cofactor cytidylyltransferase